MREYKTSDDYQPVAWMRGYPIHTATLLVGLHILTMIGTAILKSAGQNFVLAHLIFSTSAVLHHYEIWQFATYAFVNPPSLWFALQMFLLFTFGREVEMFIGRRSFVLLYIALLLSPPCLFTLLGNFSPVVYAGSNTLHFAVFVAFATLYPNVEMFFRIYAKWIALVLVGIYGLEALVAHAWTALLALSVTSALAFSFIRKVKTGSLLSFGWISHFSRRSRIQAYPKRIQKIMPREDSVEDIDPILEKISRDGMGSLTAKERNRLERARLALLKKQAP